MIPPPDGCGPYVRVEGSLMPQFILCEQIGSGSFGVIYSAKDVLSRAKVAVKLEPISAKHPQLNYEGRVLNWIHSPQGSSPSSSSVPCTLDTPVAVPRLSPSQGFPSPLWTGSVGSYICLVQSLLGPSLEDLFTANGRNFSLSTTCRLGVSMLDRLQLIHEKGFIHRDVKPDNFLMGPRDEGGSNSIGDGGTCKDSLYCIDLGLSKRWRDNTGLHTPERMGKSLTGTARYVSINAHGGCEQSRRDDLEALCYVIAYFLRGSLPWQGIRARDKVTRYGIIHSRKVQTTPEALFQGHPKQLSTLLNYARSLSFANAPNYDYCKSMLREAAGGAGDSPFDWEVRAESPGGPFTDHRLAPTTAGAAATNMYTPLLHQTSSSNTTPQPSTLPPPSRQARYSNKSPPPSALSKGIALLPHQPSSLSPPPPHAVHHPSDLAAPHPRWPSWGGKIRTSGPAPAQLSSGEGIPLSEEGGGDDTAATRGQQFEDLHNKKQMLTSVTSFALPFMGGGARGFWG